LEGWHALPALLCSNYSYFDALPLSDLEAFYANTSSAAAAAARQPSESDRMKYVLEATAPCPSQQQFLVIYVHSAPGHLSRRQAVRSKWGNVSRWSTSTSHG